MSGIRTKYGLGMPRGVRTQPIYSFREPEDNSSPTEVTSDSVSIEHDPTMIVTHYGSGFPGTFVYAAPGPEPDLMPTIPGTSIEIPTEVPEVGALDVVKDLTAMLKEERDKLKKREEGIRKALEILESKKVPFAHNTAAILRDALK